MNTGNPAEFGFLAPDEVISDLIQHAVDSEGYSDSKGIFSARKAIMQYCQLKGFPNLDINDIFTGNGVSELIVMAMQGLLDTGDEVLIPMPDYPLWTASVSLAGEQRFTISAMNKLAGFRILMIFAQKLLVILKPLF